jgi:signal transduction histidine kinase
VRHAGAHRASVTVAADGDCLLVEVTDDGAGAARSATGNGNGARQGIVGMRERARALGGTLEAGPRPEGGFRVSARLPLATAATTA